MSVWFYVALVFLIINLFFIVLFFFAKAQLFIQYKDGKFSYQARIFGVKAAVSFKKRKHKHGAKGKLISAFKPRNDLTNLGNLLLEIYEVRRALFATFGKFSRKLHFEISRLKIVVSGKNATETALLYGVASQAVSYVFEYLDNNTKLTIQKNAELSVETDYINRKSVFETAFTLHIGFFRYLVWRYVLLDLNYDKE